MATFKCTYAGLRKVAGDFLKALKEPGLTLESLEAGHDCVNLHYLGMEAEHEHENAGAAALIRVIARERIEAELRLAQK